MRREPTPNAISAAQVRHLADLARLELSAEECDSLAEELARIIGYIDQLSEIDVSAIEPMSHVHGARNVFRADEVVESLAIGDGMANAPDPHGRFFRVPLIVD